VAELLCRFKDSIVLFGYRADDWIGNAIGFRPNDSVDGLKRGLRDHKLRWKGKVRQDRRPVAIWLGGVGYGDPRFVDPHPDNFDAATLLVGAHHRLLANSPKINNKTLQKFKLFVKGWLHNNLNPLGFQDMCGFDETAVKFWLDSTGYEGWRREELLKTYQQEGINARSVKKFLKKFSLVKAFCKDEFYPDFKNARMINSRSDEFKTVVGPFFKAIEKELFQRPEFIKKVPVNERPMYIMNRLFGPGAKYFSSDFTSFESSFSAEAMDACEMQLYEYMTQNTQNNGLFTSLIRAAMCGINKMKVGNSFQIHVTASRMSGEMCTSLGNSFSNLMINLFVLSECNCTDVACVVEGDDGLFRFNGTPNEKLYAELGFEIKLAIEKEINMASFCGLVFDEHALHNIGDPSRFISRMCWGSQKYVGCSQKMRDMLLKAKALSIAYQFAGCPILSAYAHWILRKLKTAEKPNTKNSQKLEKYIKTARPFWSDQDVQQALKVEAIPRPEITSGSRYVMLQKFGVTLEVQLAAEAAFNSDDEYPYETLATIFPLPATRNSIYVSAFAECYGNVSLANKIPDLDAALKNQHQYIRTVARGMYAWRAV